MPPVKLHLHENGLKCTDITNQACDESDDQNDGDDDDVDDDGL